MSNGVPVEPSNARSSDWDSVLSTCLSKYASEFHRGPEGQAILPISAAAIISIKAALVSLPRSLSGIVQDSHQHCGESRRIEKTRAVLKESVVAKPARGERTRS